MSDNFSYESTSSEQLLNDASAFETYILTLLQHHVESQGKRFERRHGFTDAGFDAVARDGFDDFEGPVVVEVSLRYRSRFVKRKVKELIGTVIRFKAGTQVSEGLRSGKGTLLLISGQPEADSSAEESVPVGLLDDFGVRVVTWGPSDIAALAAKYPKLASDTRKNLFSLKVKDAVEVPGQGWEGRRSAAIESLARAFDSGQFTLMLGAGVSSSAGMPDWPKLLNALFVGYLSNVEGNEQKLSSQQVDELVNRLRELDSPSALVFARYLRRGIAGSNEEKRKFVGAVRKALYELRDQDKQIDSDLIQALAGLCLPRRTGAKVRSVITYNFDDLLERDLLKKGVSYKCVHTDNQFYDVEELPIYHVHGFVSEKQSQKEELDESTLVFSEDAYHQIYTDAYHWSNLTQLNALKDSTCLMVGLSLSDPNLRRLLDIAARRASRPRHFAFMRRLTVERFAYETSQSVPVGVSKDPTDVRRQVVSDVHKSAIFLERHHALTESMMSELGVTIIWYQNHDEIPEILRRIGSYPKEDGEPQANGN